MQVLRRLRGLSPPKPPRKLRLCSSASLLISGSVRFCTRTNICIKVQVKEVSEIPMLICKMLHSRFHMCLPRISCFSWSVMSVITSAKYIMWDWLSVYIIFELMGVFHLFTYPLFDVNLLKFKSEFSEFRGSFGGHPSPPPGVPK